jgi:hypothetical protein
MDFRNLIPIKCKHGSYFLHKQSISETNSTTKEYDDSDYIECIISSTVPTCSVIGNTLIINKDSYKIQYNVHSGNYGNLDLCIDENGNELYWKTSEKKFSLLKEAVLQSVAFAALSSHGIVWAVPEVKTIFSHPTRGTGFLMTHAKDTEIFANYLQRKMNWNYISESNDKILIEIICQLAVYLHILETTLYMNHRDLKCTNVVLIQETDPFTLDYVYAKRKFKLHTRLRTVLVDFGFACSNMGNTIVAAGNYLPTFDGCPKEGRDLFLFFAHLWNIEAVRNCVTPRFKEWLKNRLISHKMSWADYLIRIKDSMLKSAYLFTTSEKFSMPFCSPISVLNSLSTDFPGVLQSTPSQ